MPNFALAFGNRGSWVSRGWRRPAETSLEAARGDLPAGVSEKKVAETLAGMKQIP